MFGICCANTTDPPQQSLIPAGINIPDLGETQNSSFIKPYRPQISNWPPPLPTHPPHHTIPPLPTHPPSPGYPIAQPPTAWPPRPITQKPITQRPITQRPITQRPTQKPITQKPIYKPPSTNPIYKPPLPNPIYKPTTTKPPPRPIGDSPSFETCGAKNGYQDQGKIVGGHEADINEWPWIAALFNAGRQFCGGSLIDNTHILSAAHCVAQ